MTTRQAVQHAGEISLGVETVQLCSLCRTPDYAELTVSNPRGPLINMHFVRHSSAHGLLANRAIGNGQSRQEIQRMPI
jgi:hypothetical protein